MFIFRQEKRFRLKAIALIICSLWMAACSTDEASFQKDDIAKSTLATISKTLSNGGNVSNEDFSKIKSIYEKYPQSNTARRAYQNLLVVRKDWGTLEKVLLLVPKGEASPNDDINLAKTYIKLGRYTDAIEVSKTHKKSIESDSIMATSYFRLGKYDESKALLEENWKQILNDNRESDIILRGMMHFYDKEYDKAIEVLTPSLETNPENVPAANTLSRIYAIRNEPQKAKEYSDRVQAIFARKTEQEKNSASLVNKIRLLQLAFKEKRYQENIDLINELMPLVNDQRKAVFYEFLIKSYEGLGNQKAASDAMAKAKQLQQK